MANTATLRLENPDTGLPENATTVTLSDSTATYGIKQNSNDAVILAAGTAVTNAATGVYTYSYTALSLSPTLTYTLVWKVVTASSTTYVTEIIRPADASRSLLGYRRKLASRLGLYGVYTTSSASVASTATRELICSTLADLDSRVSAERYDGFSAYITDGALLGQQRRVVRSGYTASSGTLLLHRAFATTPATAVEFELHGTLPAIALDNVDGLREAINKALAACWSLDRLTFTGIADRNFYSLTAYPWLRRRDQLGAIYGPASTTTTSPPLWPGGGWLRLDGDTPRLEIRQTFAADETFYVDVLRPANSYIKAGGAWGESTVGLVDDADEALTDQNLVVEIALGYCYETLAVSGDQQDREKWRQMEAAQKTKAARLRDRVLPGLETSPGSVYDWRGTKEYAVMGWR